MMKYTPKGGGRANDPYTDEVQEESKFLWFEKAQGKFEESSKQYSEKIKIKARLSDIITILNVLGFTVVCMGSLFNSPEVHSAKGMDTAQLQADLKVDNPVVNYVASDVDLMVFIGSVETCKTMGDLMRMLYNHLKHGLSDAMTDFNVNSAVTNFIQIVVNNVKIDMSFFYLNSRAVYSETMKVSIINYHGVFRNVDGKGTMDFFPMLRNNLLKLDNPNDPENDLHMALALVKMLFGYITGVPMCRFFLILGIPFVKRMYFIHTYMSWKTKSSLNSAPISPMKKVLSYMVYFVNWMEFYAAYNMVQFNRVDLEEKLNGFLPRDPFGYVKHRSFLSNPKYAKTLLGISKNNPRLTNFQCFVAQMQQWSFLIIWYGHEQTFLRYNLPKQSFHYLPKRISMWLMYLLSERMKDTDDVYAMNVISLMTLDWLKTIKNEDISEHNKSLDCVYEPTLTAEAVAEQLGSEVLRLTLESTETS